MARTGTLILIALACCARVARTEGPKGDSAKDAKLVGTYTITSGEKGGKAIPAEEIEGVVIAFTRDKIVTTSKDKKELYAATYKLDTSTKPWKIAMTSTAPKKGEKADGVVKVDGGTVTICYALPGGATPTGFTTKDKQQCFTLKRVKAKSGP
jgi:uncharacterized protein (TIGR03067 family)